MLRRPSSVTDSVIAAPPVPPAAGSAWRRAWRSGLLAGALPLVAAPCSIAFGAETVNSVTVVAPTGTVDANLANNSATDSNSVRTLIRAADDAVTGVDGRIASANVLNAYAGDTIGGAVTGPGNATLALAAGASLPAGLTFDTATGNVGVRAGTAAGSYSFGYRICETANPANCMDATITVTIAATDIAADADSVADVSGSAGAANVLDVIPGDTLGGVQITLEQIVLTIVTPATAASAGAPVPTLDPATGLIGVPAGTPAGDYAIVYQICERLNPTNCASNTASVKVIAGAIAASPDAPAPVNSAAAVGSVVNVLANDTLNGAAVRRDAAALTVTAAATPIDGGAVPLLDPATGLVDVPQGTPAGTYRIDYRICELLNPSNCADSSVTIVVEAAVGNVSGTVYTDVDGNRALTPGDVRRANWIVEILRGDAVVATTTSDASGNYAVTGLPSGPGYAVRFRNPENNVVYDMIDDLTLGANTTVIDQNLPIDPSGIIYDSVTRAPIANALVTLTDASGTPLPAVCFVDPSQRSQTTGVSGEYRFDIVPGAAAQCPAGETLYRLSVTAPGGYSGPSTVLPPQAGPLDPTGLASPVRVSASAVPPTEAAPVYYLSFRLQSGDPEVIFNHVALDPFLTRSPLVVTKTSTRRSASTGELVPYEITVRNSEGAQRADVDVVDILPPGMKYVLGSASVDGQAREPESANGGRELVWHDQLIPGNGTVRYRLTLVVGAGVTGGERVNTGVAENGVDGREISNRGAATVSIVPSAVFDCSELLGKVFEDSNRNGYQDAGEPGVPAARLATVNGQLITTDEHGRYHIACAAVPDPRIGSNFVLKLDTRSLPLGWAPTTDNPRSIRLTRGKFGELNFGVAPPAGAEGEDK